MDYNKDEEEVVSAIKTDPEQIKQILETDPDLAIEVIKKIAKENDELKGIKRSTEGEEVIEDEEVVVDDDETVVS